MIPPNPTMVDLRLIRSIRTLHQVANTPPQHSMSLNFSGTWNAETQTLVWNEIPKAVSVNKTGNLGSFELVFPETGGLNLQNSERIKTGQLISAETTEVLEPSGK